MLPVLDVIDEVRVALEAPGVAVLVAPPGTGKTTAVPPALLGEPWMGGAENGGRLVVVEPRRIAARLAAARMAEVDGEPVGATFGYSVRGDRKVSDSTRVEVVTEGLLRRRLQSDPTLDGVAGVVLDEFHERSADVDLLLALLCDIRGSLRDDLRLLVMSATLDADRVASTIGAALGVDVPVVTAIAPIHPVETRYLHGSAHESVADRAVDATMQALTADRGDVLVFLPGRAEIGAAGRRLAPLVGGGVEVVELHGSLSGADQDRAVHPAPDGRRRVILATSIAESSITVPGVRIVVDAGRRRTVRVDRRSGLPEMVTVAASRAAADQRRGRAGRLGPGVTYRLWAENEHRFRPAEDAPEVLVGDLAELVLQLRAWGVTDPATLTWLDPPESDSVDRAESLLHSLGAIDTDGRLTDAGRMMASVGFHPRYAAIAVAGAALGEADLAADVLAVLETARSGSVDLSERVRAAIDWDAPREVAESRRQWRRTLTSLPRHRGPHRQGLSARTPMSREVAGLDERVAVLLLAGFGDRLARRRSGTRVDDRGRANAVFHLRGGGEVALPANDAPGELASSDWLVVVGLDTGGAEAAGRVHLAAAVDTALISQVIDEESTDVDVVEWNPGSGKLTGRRRRQLGAITIDESPLREISSEAAAAAVASVVAAQPELLGGWKRAADLRARVGFLRSLELAHTGSSRWPDWSRERLAEILLGAFGSSLGKVRSAGQLHRLDAFGALTGALDWSLHRELDDLAPTSWTTTTGRNVTLRYGEVDGDPSSVTASLRLRDAIGTDEHPTVGPRAAPVPVTLELLSPAGRPLQRTADLPGFWRGSYAQVRSEMRGRYPKHPWPERPWERS